MKNRNEIARRLALASHELRSQLPPATLLPAIHRRLDGPAQARRRLRWLSIGWAGLSTVTAALAVALVVNSALPTATPGTQVDADGFVRLVSADEWQRANAAADSTWLVNAEMPQSRLAALGLPYDPARAGERVPAQLLMRGSGEVLAVRLNR